MVLDGIERGGLGEELAELGWRLARDDRESVRTRDTGQALTLARLGFSPPRRGTPTGPSRCLRSARP